ALIAEVAALRGERDCNWEEYLAERQSRMEHGSREAGYLDQIERLNFRATEAERKLAEADALLAELANAPQPNNAGGRFTRAMASVNAYMARNNALTFLSKEAERG